MVFLGDPLSQLHVWTLAPYRDGHSALRSALRCGVNLSRLQRWVRAFTAQSPRSRFRYLVYLQREGPRVDALELPPLPVSLQEASPHCRAALQAGEYQAALRFVEALHDGQWKGLWRATSAWCVQQRHESSATRRWSQWETRLRRSACTERQAWYGFWRLSRQAPPPPAVNRVALHSEFRWEELAGLWWTWQYRVSPSRRRRLLSDLASKHHPLPRPLVQTTYQLLQGLRWPAHPPVEADHFHGGILVWERLWQKAERGERPEPLLDALSQVCGLSGRPDLASEWLMRDVD